MSKFHDRLAHNKNRFEQLNLETVIIEYADTEFPIEASPIHKRPYTLIGMGGTVDQVERLWWAISLSQLVVQTDEPYSFLPEPGLRIKRERVDGTVETYTVVVEDPQQPCFRYTSATRDRIIVCTVLEELETPDVTP